MSGRGLLPVRVFGTFYRIEGRPPVGRNLEGFGGVAQLAARRPFKPLVVGSSPTAPTDPIPSDLNDPSHYRAAVPDVDVLILLPPSEGKALGGSGRWTPAGGTFGRRLAEPRRQVVGALAEAQAHGRTGHFGVAGELRDRAIEATQRIIDGQARSLAASERFTGVVWEHLEPATLDDGQRRRILVPSALLGLVTARDPVPDHRLKFDVSLPGLGRLDRHWRPYLADALAARTVRSTTIVDLLPNEHRGALGRAPLAERRSRVVRATFTGATGHGAKAVKGRLARHLLDHGLHEASIDAFAWQGWSATFDDASGNLHAHRAL